MDIRRSFAAPLAAVLISGGATFQGCVDAARNSGELHSHHERETTVGIVQREIHQGMSAGEVASQLGAPNIVERDSEGRQTWIYDKIATEASYSRSNGSVTGVGGAGGAPGASLILGGLFGSFDKSAGASATTQKTLTVVIKFDRFDRVESFSYHSSTF